MEDDGEGAHDKVTFRHAMQLRRAEGTLQPLKRSVRA